MQPIGPYNDIRLVAQSTQRCVTLILPTDVVADLLPTGMELGDQHLTPPGTHPVNLFFHDMFDVHMNVPTLLPNMTYNEHVVGIPYVYTTRSWLNWIPSGPFYFMPILLLDSWLAIAGGRAWWGFPKVPAKFRTSNTAYQVRSLENERLVSLKYEPRGEYKPISHYPHFAPMFEMMNQPLVSVLPLAEGPLPVCSDFDKVWKKAKMRPIAAATRIHSSYVQGLPTGRFPEEGRTPGIDEAWDGAFEVRVPWRESLIYPCWFHPA